MDLYLKDALSVDAVKEHGDKLKARKAELTAFLATADDPPPLLHPSMAQLYRSRVQGLYGALQDEDEKKRTEPADIIRLSPQYSDTKTVSLVFCILHAS